MTDRSRLQDALDRRAARLVAPDGTEARGIRKFLSPQQKRISAETREIEFIVSTATRDRDGDIVEPDGWRLDRYRQNPVVLWAHDSSQPPVGRAEYIAVDGGALRARARFTDRDTYAFGDTVFRLYEGGFLSAVSAGFMPDIDAMELFEEDGRQGFRFRAQELWEFSAVPIPSNPDALVAAKGAGIDMDPLRDWIERALDERSDVVPQDVLSASYIKLAGRVHPVVQADLAARNGFVPVPATREAEARASDLIERTDGHAGVRDVEPAEAHEASPAVSPMSEALDGIEKAARGDEFTTSTEEGHAHEFALGDTETAPAGDPEHVHAIAYDGDGRAVIEDAEGHGHDTPEGAQLDLDEDEDEAGDGEAEERAPENRAPESFPLSAGEVAILRADWPELAPLADLVPASVEARDALRAFIGREKERVLDEREKALGIEIVAAEPAPVPEPGGIEVTPEVIGKLGEMVALAVDSAFRRMAGQVSENPVKVGEKA